MKTSSLLALSSLACTVAYAIWQKEESAIIAAILVVGSAIIQQLEKLSK